MRITGLEFLLVQQTLINAIQQFCCLEVKNEVGIINPTKSTKEGLAVLGWFSFPLITRFESDMVKQIEEWGYEDVMQNIWFCHHPVKGEPCGVCHPCEVKMESDMQWLLPEKAKKRYRFYKRLKAIGGNAMGRMYISLFRRMFCD